MSINPINLAMKSIAPLESSPLGQAKGATATPSNSKTNFSQMFSDAIKEVDNMQTEADRQIEGTVLGGEGVTTHGAMIALEKADIAFQLMTTIRSKIIRAYEDVIRTQV